MALKAYFFFSYLLLDFPLFDTGTTALCQEVKFGRYDFYEYEFQRYTRIFIFSVLFSYIFQIFIIFELLDKIGIHSICLRKGVFHSLIDKL